MEVTYRSHRRHHSKENYFTPSSIGNVNSENLKILDFASSDSGSNSTGTNRSKSRGKQHCAITNTNNVLSTGSENKVEPRGAFQLHLDGSISIIRKEEKSSKVKKHATKESCRPIIGILKKNFPVDKVPTSEKQRVIQSKKQHNKTKIQFTSQVTIHKYNNHKRSDNRTISEITEMLWYTTEEYEMMEIDRKHCIAYLKGALIYNYKIDSEYYTVIGLEKYLSYGQIMYAKKQEDDDVIRQKYTDRMKSSSSSKTNHAYHQISQLMMKQNLNHHVHKSIYGQQHQKSFLLLQSDERRHRKQQKVYRSTDLIQSNNNIKQLQTMTVTSAATATAATATARS